MVAQERPERDRTGLLLLGLVILALVLRFWRLGDWNFQGTEMFTLRDSLTPKYGNSRPLGYLLNYFLVRPFIPLDEFGLRLLPAVFGVLAVPVFYLVTRRLLGTRAALFGTLFLTVSPLHIYYSQLARYWSLVFLLSAVYPYAIYIGLREHNRRALVVGLVTCVLAVLAHPVSVLLLGGLGLWFLLSYARSSYWAELWARSSVRWGVSIAVILVVAITVRLVPILQRWISAHDKNPGSGQFLLPPPGAAGMKQVLYVVAYAESLTLPLALAAVVGIYLLWRERDRSLALLLTCLALFPVIFLTLISIRTPVSTYYLLAAVPAVFMGAGIFLDRLAGLDWKPGPRWLLPGTVALMMISAGVPTLLSDYRDGRRYDFRRAAEWLKPRLAPGDVVYSDQPMVLAHYLPVTPVQRLRYDPAPLQDSVRTLNAGEREGTLWIVAPAPSHALRTNLKRGGMIDWIFDSCQLRYTRGVGRVDFRQQYLQIYRCPPAKGAGVSSE